MRELEVLGSGHLRLDFADWKEFFETEMAEQDRAPHKPPRWDTNVIERAFREVRRRTRPMSSFSNLESCDRIVYGVISHLNRSWERKPLP